VHVGYVLGAPIHPLKEHLMGSTMDKAKGNLKETAGDLTGDKDLENEGKVDKTSGKVKEKVGEAADKVKDVFTKD